MAALTSLLNIGKELERKLNTIGITTSEELKANGSEDAFIKLKQTYPEVCLVHLYALEGAVTGTKYNQLHEDIKQKLKTISDRCK